MGLKNFKKPILLVILSLLLHYSVYGQAVSWYATPKNIEKKSLKEVIRIEDSIKIIQKMKDLGFLSFKIDSIDRSHRPFILYSTQGDPWYISSISYFEDSTFKKLPTHLDKLINSTYDKISIVNSAEVWQKEKFEKGYLFAGYQIETKEISPQKLHLGIHAYSGFQVRLDSFLTGKSTVFKPTFLYKWSGLKRNEPIQWSKLQRLKKKIQALPYIERIDSIPLVIKDDRVYPVLSLKEKKTNVFDALLGFQGGEGNKQAVGLSGYVTLEIYNPFKAGREFSLKYIRLRTASSQLYSSILLPMLFGSPLGVGGELTILKEDSSFVNMDRAVFLRMPTNSIVNWQLFYRNQSSTVLGVSNTELPWINYSIQKYGFKIVRPWVPLLNIHWKSYINFESSFGRKHWPTSENSIAGGKGPQNQVETKIRFDLEWKPTPQMGFYVSSQAAWMHSKLYFQNEWFRIGGLQSIRGYAENAFYTRSYAFMRTEYRLYWESSSYIFLCVDPALLWVTSGLDRVIGSGVGLQIHSKSGIFQLIYAMKADKRGVFKWGESKVHIGYLSTF